MGQSMSQYYNLPKQLKIPSLMVEIFSDHCIDRLEAIDPNAYVHYNINLWPRSSDGEHYVPYFFVHGYFSDAQKKIVRETMDLINENTCVKFIPSTRPQHALYITGEGEGFAAAAGRTTFRHEQKAILDPRFYERHRSCIAHELFHVLGRHHEHQREDRDDYITVMPDAKGQISKIRGWRPEVKYDHNSVMHYPPAYIDDNGDLKILFFPKNGAYFWASHRVRPSDFEHINTMYRCDQKYFDRAQRYPV